MNVSERKFSFKQLLTDIRSLMRDAWANASIFALAAIIIHNLYEVKYFVLMIGIALGYAFGFALNDYFDKDYDLMDDTKAKRNFFIRSGFKNYQAMFFILLIIFILYLIFQKFGILGIVFLVISLFVLWAYSAEPIRLKSRPGLDLLTHSVFLDTYPYFLVLVLSQSKIINIDYFVMSLTILLSMSEQLENQIRDYAIDKKTDINFSVKFGVNTSVKLLKILVLCSIAIIVLVIINEIVPFHFYPIALIIAPWLLYKLVRTEKRVRSEKLNRYTSIGALSYLIILVIMLKF
ncbi:MAG: UbiA family prenyltransferase [Candidatus Heimdallarchaeota archaeon]|nr:UbiA family prenyltransferase [Candidatus Heimdallarchaeota archaeon]MDH5645985.1 UbiA family prenyltransferase [Candidatus Heimdallarchaeota archaeon]